MTEPEAAADYLMRVFGLSEAGALDVIDLLTNDDRIEELRSGLAGTIERLVSRATEGAEGDS